MSLSHKRLLMLMLRLGLIGEYVGRIYISLNASPQYIIKEIYGSENVDFNGYDVYGKTGTAEYTNDKKLAHSWFVGYAKNDEIKQKSSSGGIFSLVANYILENTHLKNFSSNNIIQSRKK